MLEIGILLLLQWMQIMKFTATTKDLSQNLALAARAVPSRASHAILTNILVNADSKSNRVSFTGFDLAFGISTSFEAEVSQSGSIALPAKIFSDIAARLSDHEVTLEMVDSEDSQVLLKCGRGKFTLSVTDGADFPHFPEVNGSKIELTAEVLLRGLRATLFAASTDETKQILQGVNISHDKEVLNFASTDGHRLAVIEIPVENISDVAVTPPRRQLHELVALLIRWGNDQLVELELGEQVVNFRVGGNLLTTRTIDGDYPAYRQLLPKEFVNNTIVSRTDLLSVLGRVAVMADQKFQLVKFTVNATELIISSATAEVGRASESLPAQHSGDPIVIGFNYKYLVDGLKSMTSEDVVIKSNSPLSPVIFVPMDGSKMWYLTMPIQLRE